MHQRAVAITGSHFSSLLVRCLTTKDVMKWHCSYRPMQQSNGKEIRRYFKQDSRSAIAERSARRTAYTRLRAAAKAVLTGGRSHPQSDLTPTGP